jgi:hypothetical protein
MGGARHIPDTARRPGFSLHQAASPIEGRGYDAAPVTVTYDLSGRLAVSVDEDDAAVAAAVAEQMRPFGPADGGDRPADVAIAADLPPLGTFRDVQNPARDGTVTAFDGERFCLLLDGRACALPDPLRDRPARFSYARGFPLGRIYRTVVRPALQLSLAGRGAVAVHAAATEVGGRAVLVAGWSESGKTETALALAEDGGSFLSDKWTVLGSDGQASAFPNGVGIRRWVLPYLPRLAANLPPRARAQLGTARMAAALTRPVRERRGAMAAVAARAVALGDRAALTPAQVRAAYGQRDDPARRVPLGATAVLTTVSGGDVACRPASPAWAAARLARSAAVERRELMGLFERRAYAVPGEEDGLRERAVQAETGVLERALAAAPVLDVRAPFPADPRIVAEAIARRL